MTKTLNKKTENENKSHQGSITFNKKSIVFLGTAIQLKNVSKFEKYGLKPKYTISQTFLIISGILTLVGMSIILSQESPVDLQNSPYVRIPTIIFGFITSIGIRERFKPQRYGLTIQLNSGANHHFLTKDKVGVDKLFEVLTESLENDKTFTALFEDRRVTITNSNITGVGDHNTFL